MAIPHGYSADLASNTPRDAKPAWSYGVPRTIHKVLAHTHSDRGPGRVEAQKHPPLAEAPG